MVGVGVGRSIELNTHPHPPVVKISYTQYEIKIVSYIESARYAEYIRIPNLRDESLKQGRNDRRM